MHVSPPIALLAIMVVLLTVVAWLAPLQRQAVQVPVLLPTATYQKLIFWGKEQADAEGKALTVVQVIEKLANKQKTDTEAR
jgi:biopolymer transport protein ExbD